jgi:hypothetical protein
MTSINQTIGINDNMIQHREVAYQIEVGGITKELKVAQKKVWPTFPI